MQASTQTAGEALLRISAVTARTGLGKSAIYDGIKAGTFPPYLKLGRASAWPSSAIDAWIAERIAASNELRRFAQQRSKAPA